MPTFSDGSSEAWVRSVNKQLAELSRRGGGRSGSSPITADVSSPSPPVIEGDNLSQPDVETLTKVVDDEEHLELAYDVNEDYSLTTPVESVTDIDYSLVVPSQPLTNTAMATISVGWDGYGAGGEAMPPNLATVEVHRSMEGPDFTADDATKAGNLRDAGYISIADQQYGEQWWYRLVMVNTDGARSDPSEASLVIAVKVAPTDVGFSASDIDFDGFLADVDAKATQASIDAAAAETAAANADALTSNWVAVDGLSIDGGKLYAESVTANAIAAGTITAGSGIIGSVDAATITVGKITAAQIAAGTITSASGVIGSLSANNITTGTLDAAVVNVINLSASNIITGTLTGIAITGATITGTTSIIGATFKTALTGPRVEIAPTPSYPGAVAGEINWYDTHLSGIGLSNDRPPGVRGYISDTYNNGGVMSERYTLNLTSGAIDSGVSASIALRGQFSDAHAGGESEMWLTAEKVRVFGKGIVSDDMRPTAIREGTGKTTTTSTYTPTAATVANCGLVFVAPPSGAITIHLTALMRSQVAAKYCRVDYQIRTGSTIGGGTTVYAGDTGVATCMMATVSVDFHREAGVAVYSGLTPGATYNIYSVMASHDGVSNVSVAGTTLAIIPTL